MKIYTQTDEYTIWENENYLYFIQMSGQEVESKSFDFAADAIEEAVSRRKYYTPRILVDYFKKDKN